MHRYVIYGAGGVGSLLGGRLAAVGDDVLLVGRPAHMARIAAEGLRIVETDGSTTVVSVPAATAPDPRPEDVVILAAKSYDTPTALAELGRLYDRDTPIVCLQNGVRNEPRARKRFRNVYGALTNIGAQYLTPGQVDALGPKGLAIGVYPTGADELVDELVAAAQRAGFAATSHSNVMAPKWTKVATNCHNAIFALCDVTVGATYDDPDGCALAQALREEARAVFAAAGISHDPIPDVGRPGTMPQAPVPMFGSTWMDFRLGRGRSETEEFNGTIVRLGRRHGVPTPVNALILHLARAAARRNTGPGGCTLAGLRQMAESATRLAR